MELEFKSGCWIVANDERAIDKACQALRDGKSEKILSIASDKKRKRTFASNSFDLINKMPKTSNKDLYASKKVEENEYKETHGEIDQSLSLDFSAYDDIILASLQKCYDKNHRSSSVGAEVNQRENKYDKNVCDEKSLISEEGSMSCFDRNGLYVNCLDENDKFYDDIFMAFECQSMLI